MLSIIMELVTGAIGLIRAKLLYKLAVNSDSKVCSLYRNKINRRRVKQYFYSLDKENSKNYDKII